MTWDDHQGKKEKKSEKLNPHPQRGKYPQRRAAQDNKDKTEGKKMQKSEIHVRDLSHGTVTNIG